MSHGWIAAVLAATTLACGAAAAQQQYLYVWTAGVDGQGDGSDKLVTVDATRASDRYGKVVHALSVGGRGELASFALGGDGRTLRAARATDGRVFEFDVGSDPSRPRMRRASAGPPAPSGAADAAPREARDATRVFVAGAQLRSDPDPAHFVRAYQNAAGELTIAFELDFRAPRLGLPRAVVLLDRPAR
jgi:selenium-binding protein 1